METAAWIIGGVFVLLLLLGIIIIIWTIRVYNNLIGYRESYRNAFSAIDTILQQRYSTLTNIVEVVKGYVKHEHDTLVNVVHEWGRLFQSNGNVNKSALSSKFALVEDGAFRMIRKLKQKYPEIKADKRFIKAEKLLEENESQLTIKRSFYNSAVQQFILHRDKFPTILISRYLFPEKPEYFEAPSYAKEEVKMKFDVEYSAKRT